MSKIALQFESITIYWYGVLVAAGIGFGIWTASRRGQKENLSSDWFYDLFPWLVGGAICGARLLHVVSYWSDSYAHEPFWHVFAVWQGGLVYYGGLIGASIATIIFLRVKRLPFWKMADALAPSIALGQMFGRAGCFVNGCCYGRLCDMPWAVVYPPEYDLNGFAIHPVQIYEASLNALLFLGLSWLYQRKKFDGQVFAAYLVCYGIIRSFVELFRGDYGVHVHGWITPAHYISVILLALGVALFIKCPRPEEK